MQNSTKELSQTTNDLADLLDRVAKMESWVKQDRSDQYHINFITTTKVAINDREQYIVKLKDEWLVIRTKDPDEHDFMRLDRALRRQIELKKLGFLMGTGSDLNAIVKLASVYIPVSEGDRAMWFSGSHETEEAIALLKAYVEATEAIAAKQAHADIK